MSYILVPHNEAIKEFKANHPAFLALLHTAARLCPDEYVAVRFLPPKDRTKPDTEYPHGWGPNDGQRVAAAGAANLGRAIVRQAGTAEARQNLLASWNAWRTGPADSEADRRNGDRLKERLRDFGEFLIQSGGFEIW